MLWDDNDENEERISKVKLFVHNKVSFLALWQVEAAHLWKDYRTMQ